MNSNHKTVVINVSFNHKNVNISISLNLSLAHLKQLIFTHFQIDTMHYSLYYKKTRIGLSDQRPSYTILGKEKNPKFYIIKKEPKSNEQKNDEKYDQKNKVVHQINKQQISLGSKTTILRNNVYFLKKNNTQNILSSVNNRSSLPSIQSHHNSQTILSASNIAAKKKYHFKIKPPYVDSSTYMSFEERRIKEAYDDKKNWIDKRGFFKNVGSYSMKPLLIPNYVYKTPSEPPLNHQFREIKKKLWLDQRGFLLA